MKISMHRRPGTYSVHRLAPDSPLPPALLQEPFYALLKSERELSVCCRSDLVLPSESREDGWGCLAVDGPLDFDLTGIVSAIAAPLADDGIPLFVISSFDTDYVLVKQENLERAAAALAREHIQLRCD